MHRVRVSIAAIMATVVVAAVGLAALKNANPTWVGVMQMLSLALLGASVLGVVYRRDATRAWHLGFAVFGLAYFTIAFGPYFAAQARSGMPTTQLLSYAYDKLHPDQPKGATIVWTTTTAPGGISSVQYGLTATPASNGSVTNFAVSTVNVRGPATLFSASGSSEHFVEVGHVLAALLVAALGGLLGRWFHATSRGRGRDEAEGQPAA